MTVSSTSTCLAAVDPETLAVAGISHYARTVESARQRRRLEGKPETDWIVLRNRLSMLSSRNKASVGAALQDLSQRLGFRYVEGLAERVVFREFYPRGVTALDELNEATLGSRPTMSHLSAQLEVHNLLRALLNLGTAEAEPADEAHARPYRRRTAWSALRRNQADPNGDRHRVDAVSCFEFSRRDTQMMLGDAFAHAHSRGDLICASSIREQLQGLDLYRGPALSSTFFSYLTRTRDREQARQEFAAAMGDH